MDTDPIANVCSAKSEEEILREIRFFIARFFLANIEQPVQEDVMQSERLSELTLLLMAQMLQRGMKKKRTPVYNVMFYIEDLGGGVGKMHYSFETASGDMHQQLGLKVMGEKLEEAIGKWCEEVWGG